ncbi:MAG: hypothetical protein KC713_04475 [Candidatus Omnitrophica bacterium]|nr:hypothetical protein [Candidatus Omnitrophota bacterium]
MKRIGRKSVKIFKIQNRKGYAALCSDCLTEGRTPAEAFSRMEKAVARIERKLSEAKKKKKR